MLPNGRFVKLDNSHRIYDSFFQIKDIEAIVHPMTGIRPSYYGSSRTTIRETHDLWRTMTTTCRDTGSGRTGIHRSTPRTRRKLGVNYVIRLTH